MREGGQVMFLSAPATGPWRATVESRGHSFSVLPLGETAVRDSTPPHAHWAPWGQQADAAAVVEFLHDPVDLLIVDHYAFDARWERATRSVGRRLLVIDDLADRDHDCDILLDHNPQDELGSRYETLLPLHTVRLIGPHYALLRPEFINARAGRNPRDGTIRRIMVFMGGTDPVLATPMILAVLSLPDFSALPVDIATSAANNNLSVVESAAAVRGNVSIHVDTPSIADLFAAADLAIGAGGVAMMERCCVGLPTVALSIAENQKQGLEWLSHRGVIHYLGDFNDLTDQRLADALRHLLSSPDEMRLMASRAGALVDGLGTDRIVSVLTGHRMGICIRPATFDDAQILYRWRNSDDVRAASFNGDQFSYDDHLRWFSQALVNGGHVILIGFVGECRVGSVRYAIADDGAGVSIVVDPTFYRRGVGRELLEAGERYLRSSHSELLQLRAAIKPDNVASRRLFAGCGFSPVLEEPNRVLYVKELG